MPNPLQGIWLEARCSRDALPEKRLCEVCEFSGLLGVIDGDVPDWMNMWGNNKVNGEGITESNMKIILTSSNIAHMFTDGIGLQNAPVESVRIRANVPEKPKREVRIKRKNTQLIEAGEHTTLLESLKVVEESLSRVEMPGKKKVIAKKKPIPLEFETATIIKSHATCIGVHYVESDLDVVEVAEVIYKKVKKEVVDLNGSDVICYNDQGIYYSCGPNGEIKGIIEIEDN
jgi:hypothetical protein